MEDKPILSPLEFGPAASQIAEMRALRLSGGILKVNPPASDEPSIERLCAGIGAALREYLQVLKSALHLKLGTKERISERELDEALETYLDVFLIAYEHSRWDGAIMVVKGEPYLRDIVSDRLARTDPGKRVDIRVDGFEVSLSQAIQLGILISELLGYLDEEEDNSPGQDLSIVARQSEDSRVTIAVSGGAVPRAKSRASMDLSKPSLLIAKTMAEQMRSRLEYHRYGIPSLSFSAPIVRPALGGLGAKSGEASELAPPEARAGNRDAARSLESRKTGKIFATARLAGGKHDKLASLDRRDGIRRL